MPSHIAHLAYASYLYPRFLPGEAEGGVLLGTLFPDIRYQARLHRASTHPAVVGVVQLWHSEGFRQGFLLHNAIDLAWDHFLRERQDLLAGLERRVANTTLKLAIDHYHWPTISTAFLEACEGGLPYAEAEAFGVSSRQLERWYGLMAWYVSHPPTIERQRRLGREMGVSEEAVEKIAALSFDMIESGMAAEAAIDFYRQLPQLLCLSRDS